MIDLEDIAWKKGNCCPHQIIFDYGYSDNIVGCDVQQRMMTKRICDQFRDEVGLAGVGYPTINKNCKFIKNSLELGHI